MFSVRHPSWRYSAVGRYGGALKDVAVQELAATVIRAILERNDLAPDAVDDVILGNCYPNSEAPALAYATVYPLATVLRILIAQVLALVLCG